MKIGFIGLGIMGEVMCLNIIKSSKFQVMVFDIDSRKIEQFKKYGAEEGKSIAYIGRACDVIITMVPTSSNVKEVYNELLPVIERNKILMDMSTIEPWVSKELSEEVSKKGAYMLDAPVVKSRAAAECGKLGIYVGGNYDIYEKVKPILMCMGSNITHLGKNGNGLIMKICHNMLVAQIQNGVNEMFVLTQAAGIGIDEAATAISYGGGQNFYMDSKKSTIKSMDFSPKFTVKNMNKDIKIAANLSENLGLKLRGIDNVVDVYRMAVEEGFKGEDFSSTYKIIKNFTGLKEGEGNNEV